MEDSRSVAVRALEFYSGIGGLHLALKRSRVKGTVIQAFDWDQGACKVYSANHGSHIAAKTDISELSVASISSFRANLWILSPACQPYTVLNPNAKGALDPRAKSFLHLIQTVLPELAAMHAHPTHLLVENVGGFEGSTTRQVLLSMLHTLGYTTAEFLLTPLQFGIPNSRLRYYLLAKTLPFEFHSSVRQGEIYRHLPTDQGNCKALCHELEDGCLSHDQDVVVRKVQEYLDRDPGMQTHTHSVPDKVLQKWGRLFDIVLPSARRTCCFTRGYTQLVERAGSILQMNAELDTTETFNTFLAAQAAGHPDAIAILHPLRLRYFSPSELLRLFDFTPLSNRPDSTDLNDPSTPITQFIWPEEISAKTKYRLIGNSVNVRVVTALIDLLYEDWESTVL